MANIRVKQRLTSLTKQAETIARHVGQHSGVSAKDAAEVDKLCSDAIQSIAYIAEVARVASGTTRGKSLQRAIRKALGFTYP